MLMKDPTLNDNREIRARLFELVFVLANAVLTVMKAPQGQREKLWCKCEGRPMGFLDLCIKCCDLIDRSAEQGAAYQPGSFGATRLQMIRHCTEALGQEMANLGTRADGALAAGLGWEVSNIRNTMVGAMPLAEQKRRRFV